MFTIVFHIRRKPFDAFFIKPKSVQTKLQSAFLATAYIICLSSNEADMEYETACVHSPMAATPQINDVTLSLIHSIQ